MVKSENIARQGAGLLATQQPKVGTSGLWASWDQGSCHPQSSILGNSGAQRALNGRERSGVRPGAGRLQAGLSHHQPGQAFPFNLLPAHLSWPDFLVVIPKFSSVRLLFCKLRPPTMSMFCISCCTGLKSKEGSYTLWCNVVVTGWPGNCKSKDVWSLCCFDASSLFQALSFSAWLISFNIISSWTHVVIYFYFHLKKNIR